MKSRIGRPVQTRIGFEAGCCDGYYGQDGGHGAMDLPKLLHGPLSTLTTCCLSFVLASSVALANQSDSKQTTSSHSSIQINYAGLGNIDDLGFNQVIDNTLFGASSVELQTNTTIVRPGIGPSPVKKEEVTGLIEVEADSTESNIVEEGQGIRYLDGFYAQGLKIKRISADWKTSSGTLTVGNDWANFQDYLGKNFISNEGAAYFSETGLGSVSSGLRSGRTAEFIRWTNPNGFSVSLEDIGDPMGQNGEIVDSQLSLKSSPGLVLSWQNPLNEQARYRVSAIGRTVELENSEVRATGWGLNVEGGWRFGDLFAALSVTIGDGIDSLIFKDGREDAKLTSDGGLSWVESIAIKPSLQYSLSDRSDLHVSLGHFVSKEPDFGEVDTLDTIHLGYTWSPWPSTRFGVEVGRAPNRADNGSPEGSTRVQFGASKRF